MKEIDFLSGGPAASLPPPADRIADTLVVRCSSGLTELANATMVGFVASSLSLAPCCLFSESSRRRFEGSENADLPVHRA